LNYRPICLINAVTGKVGTSQPSVAFAEDKVNSLSVLHDNHPGTVPQEECIFAFGRNLSAAYIPQSETSRSEIARLVIWRDFPQCPYVTKARLELVLCQPLPPALRARHRGTSPPRQNRDSCCYLGRDSTTHSRCSWGPHRLDRFSAMCRIRATTESRQRR
jgi:hypothetical protein